MAILKDLIVQGESRLIGDTIAGDVTADKLAKSGGTSSQFLKADGSVDSNSYATTSQLTTLGTQVNNIEETVSDKQDKLVSGTNIKTINGGSLLDSGNISIPISPFVKGEGTNSAKISRIDNIASGTASFAAGRYVNATAEAAHAEGGGNWPDYDDCRIYATGDGAHAEGFAMHGDVIASGEGAHAEGVSTVASGKGAHAEGRETTASGWNSHAEGDNTEANETTSHVEGSFSKANGVASHAEGIHTTASGNYSHTEGYYTYANNGSAHAEGNYTSARGDSSHAEGSHTTAIGVASHAEGLYCSTNNINEHAQGRYNKSNHSSNVFGSGGNTTHSIGIGTGADAAGRKNAVEVMENGDMYVIGLGGYTGMNANTLNARTIQKVITDLNKSGLFLNMESMVITENETPVAEFLETYLLSDISQVEDAIFGRYKGVSFDSDGDSPMFIFAGSNYNDGDETTHAYFQCGNTKIQIIERYDANDDETYFRLISNWN